jgi:hypothetical protein
MIYPILSDDAPPNETVEKLILQISFPVRGIIESPVSRIEGGCTDVFLCQGSADRPKRVDLADIVNQGEQSPLYIHFQLGP